MLWIDHRPWPCGKRNAKLLMKILTAHGSMWMI